MNRQSIATAVRQRTQFGQEEPMWQLVTIAMVRNLPR